MNVKGRLSIPAPVWIWGVPLTPWTRTEALQYIAQMIDTRDRGYFITANLHYAMLCHRDEELQRINGRARFILADGMPMVWASRRQARPLPERVAGSDLLFLICEQAARLGHRLFFLGAAPGVAAEAADKLRQRYPGLQIVGTEAPPFRRLSTEEHAALIERIRAARPDILFVAFGQPKGEKWMAENEKALDIPVMVQVGASLDFAAGRVRRAPRWVQKSGMEWIYRILQEPRRLFLRYMEDLAFLFRMLFSSTGRKKRPGKPASHR